MWGLTVSQDEINEALRLADFKESIEVQKTDPYDVVKGVGNRSVATAEVLSGDLRGTLIRFIYWGGEGADRGSFYSGFARPRVGQRYQASLKKLGDEIYEVAGFEFGLTPVTPSRSFTRNRTDGSNGEGSGAFLYWDTKYFPIPYFIAESTFRNRPELITEIDQSFATWRNLESTPIEFVATGCTNSQLNENDGINSIILITKDWPFDSAAIAITRNFYVAGASEYSGLILDSDIMLNGVDHQFTNGVEASKHNLRNIVTHEVGHFLGLGHEVTPVSSDSTMYAVASTGEVKKQTLSANDISGIESAYRGVGEKLANHNSYCAAAEQNNGCRLGIRHGKREFPLGFFLSWLFILIQIPLARLLLKFS